MFCNLFTKEPSYNLTMEDKYISRQHFSGNIVQVVSFLSYFILEKEMSKCNIIIPSVPICFFVSLHHHCHDFATPKEKQTT